MPSVSKSQQRLMGMAYAVKSGDMEISDIDPAYRDKVKSLSDGMTKKDLKKYASTKHDDLPETVDEDFAHAAQNITPSANIGGMGPVVFPSDGIVGSGDVPAVADIDDDEEEAKKDKTKKKLEMEGLTLPLFTRFEDFIGEAFEEIIDLTKALHFETDPDRAEEMKIELGKRQGEVVTRKQIEGGNYSLRRFRKKIKYDETGEDLGVFKPGSYMAATSKLGDGPHKKAVKKIRWNQKMYDQWLEDVASNGGWEHAFDMAQNAKHERGLIDWVKKNYRGEDPMQRIQWDIEAFAESVVTEAKGFKNTKDFEAFLKEIDGMPESAIKKIMKKDYIDTPGFYEDEKDNYEDVIDFMMSNMGREDFEALEDYWKNNVAESVVTEGKLKISGPAYDLWDEKEVQRKLRDVKIKIVGDIGGVATIKGDDKELQKVKDILGLEGAKESVAESNESEAEKILQDLLDERGGDMGELHGMEMEDALDTVEAYGHKGSKAKKIAQELFSMCNESVVNEKSWNDVAKIMDAGLKKAVKKGITTLRYAKDYVKSLERMANKEAKKFFDEYGDFTEDDFIEDVRYNMANEKVKDHFSEWVALNEKKEDRDGMMKFIKKHMSFVGTSEDFNGSEGGIHVSGEDYDDEFKGKQIYDYYSEDYKNREFGVLNSWEKELNKKGWYSEWYDAGTVMIWPL